MNIPRRLLPVAAVGAVVTAPLWAAIPAHAEGASSSPVTAQPSPSTGASTTSSTSTTSTPSGTSTSGSAASSEPSSPTSSPTETSPSATPTTPTESSAGQSSGSPVTAGTGMSQTSSGSQPSSGTPTTSTAPSSPVAMPGGSSTTTTEAPAPASDPIVTAELFWLMPDGGTAEHVTYPQTPVDPTACVPSNPGTIQDDIVRGTAAQIAALRDPAGPAGVNLAQGEDSAIIVSWSFSTQSVCPPPALTKVTPAIAITTYCNEGDSTRYNDAEEVDGEGYTWDTDGYLGGTAYIATPKPGFELVGPFTNGGRLNDDGTVTFTVAHMTDENDCPVVVTPPTTPPTPPVTPPTHPAPPVTPPTHTNPAPVKHVTPVVFHAAPVVDRAAAVTPAPKVLGYTGSSDTIGGLLAAGAAAVAGIAFVAVGRRRSRRS